MCDQASDRDFCALIEHELYRIGGEDGEALYSEMTGLPKHYLAGHDVEEFIGVTKRWGADESVKRLVEVAKQTPFVSLAKAEMRRATRLAAKWNVSVEDEWVTALGSFRVIHIQQDPASTIWKCQLGKI